MLTAEKVQSIRLTELVNFVRSGVNEPSSDKRFYNVNTSGAVARKTKIQVDYWELLRLIFIKGFNKVYRAIQRNKILI